MKTWLVLLLFASLPCSLLAQSAESRLRDAGILLPDPPRPLAQYVPWVRTGQWLFLSGHGYCGQPTAVDTGKLGRDRQTEEGYLAARHVGLCMLATLRDALGDLDRVERIVRVSGMINASDDFTEHSKVMNGFSDLMIEVFGEAGRHVRAAVGMASLPNNMAVEVEMLVLLREEKE